jgi:hypothetical protein
MMRNFLGTGTVIGPSPGTDTPALYVILRVLTNLSGIDAKFWVGVAPGTEAL